MIAFIGSVFSPYYAWARGRGRGDPLHHCALNVVLYGEGPRRWAMTERGRTALARDTHTLRIGPSALTWDGDTLVIRIEERSVPRLQHLRGTIRLHPRALETATHALDDAGRHRWQPIAPCARAEIDLAEPALTWSGPAYLDSNAGEAPLEADFRSWNWSRTPGPDATTIFYETERTDGTARALSLAYANGGGLREIDLPPPASLPPTRWRMARATRSEQPATVLSTLEDAPFYSRSMIRSTLGGQSAVGMHESLSMRRFIQPAVQAMLPFRMPRRSG